MRNECPWSAPPFFGRRFGGRFDARQDLGEASPRGGLVLEFGVQFPIGGNQGAGAADHEGDLVVGVAAVGEDHDAREGREIVLDGAEGMVETACDLVGLEPLEVEAYGLNAVGLSGADVPLLTAGGDFDPPLEEGLDIADDGADPAVEQSEGEVLIAEQAALIACFGSEAEDAGAAQALDTVSDAGAMILLSGVEGESDGDLLALLQGLAGGFGGGDDQELDLSQVELAVGVVGVEGIDLLDGLEDGLRDERGAVGALFDPASKQVIERLGIEPSLAELVLEELGPHHERHLRSET